jgi:hypothetical protein
MTRGYDICGVGDKGFVWWGMDNVKREVQCTFALEKE